MSGAVQNRRMDDIVKQAMIKWPNVPDCYGWLGLDARGRWFIRDEPTQASGGFPVHKGSELRHEKLLEFMARNYESDERGLWFFQNGPQRVYVELECTPWIWSMEADGSILAHTNEKATALRCLLDEAGKVYLVTELGFGLLRSQDVGMAALKIESGSWMPESVASSDLEEMFGFVRSPQLRQRGA